jgi:hypothetical protein
MKCTTIPLIIPQTWAKRIIERAKRFFEIPDFRQYSIADGIYKVLFASRTGIMPDLIRRRNKKQLLLLFAIPY